jgi:hypothetical protein
MPSTYKYSYPNWKSYSNIPPRPGVGLYNGQLLRHGYIYGYKKVAADVNPYTGASTDSGTGNVHPVPPWRQIDYSNVMVFQFNPVDLPMTVGMFPADPPEAEAPGGNLPSVAAGMASSNLKLFFDRTNEVARATANLPGRAGESKWKDIGVQWDLFDLFKVISGGDESFLDEQRIPTPDNDDDAAAGSVDPRSLTNLTGMLLDAAATGAKLYFKPFVVVFNQNLAVNVTWLNSMSFSYLRFTADLVPTLVQVDMSLQISNMGSKSYVVGTNAPAGSTPPTAPPGVTPPGSTYPPGGGPR